MRPEQMGWGGGEREESPMSHRMFVCALVFSF